MATAANGAAGVHDAAIAVQATNTGSFTAEVSSIFGGSGTYNLNMARIPGDFVVSPGDNGGPLTNGWKQTGALDIGDLDVWSFDANAGDTLVMRMASASYNPYIRLYGPSGGLVATAGSGISGNLDASLSVLATNAGTYNAVVSSVSGNSTGSYLLNLARMPGAFFVAPGDEGGALAGGATPNGVIDAGDMDLWQFEACRGHIVSLSCQKLSGASFSPRLRIYSRTGALLATAVSASVATISFSATNSGTYTAIVDGGNVNDAGTYALSGNGFSDGLNLCIPIVTNTNLELGVVVGGPGATFILYTSTNVALPAASWTPILTNQFDQFGVFDYTSSNNPATRQQFYRLIQQ